MIKAFAKVFDRWFGGYIKFLSPGLIGFLIWCYGLIAYNIGVTNWMDVFAFWTLGGAFFLFSSLTGFLFHGLLKEWGVVDKMKEFREEVKMEVENNKPSGTGDITVCDEDKGGLEVL